MPAVELTVLVVTYDHADYIETAIDSVLLQETEFDYEVIISEDCSTDGTTEIVKQLAASHPDRIRLLLSERNLNDNSVVRRGLEAARGRYVALLDGDDFWTAKTKLQQQFEFLEAHPGCSSCFHNVNVIYEQDGTAPHLFNQDELPRDVGAPKPKPISTLADIVRGDFIPSCSVVFRSEIGRELPSWFDELWAGDWVLHVLSAQHGDIAYLDEVMGTYRVHPDGFWSMNWSKYRRLSDVEEVIRTYDTFNRHLGFSFNREIETEAAALYQVAAIGFYKRGEYQVARVCARRCLRRVPIGRWHQRWKALAVVALSGLKSLALPRRSPERRH
ncbi:MAG: glycosyltransferase [Solirubrobacterales bacterium]